MRRYSGFAALLVLMAAAAWFAVGDNTTATSTAPTSGAGSNSGGKDCDVAENCRADPQRARVPVGTGFDFYVLALSWSPSYCRSADGAGNRQQCAADRDLAFVVHGLWPQNERGYPESCPSDEPDRVPDSLGRSLFDIMPGMGLIGHQWRKHGTCSGLSQKDYFAVVRSAWNRVAIPPALRQAEKQQSLSPAEISSRMAAANPRLTAASMMLACDGQRLSEIRICLTKDLTFRDCAEAGHSTCNRNTVVLPPAP